MREVTTPEAAEFQLLARDGKYGITRPADNRSLVAEIQGYTNETALQAIQRLEHIHLSFLVFLSHKLIKSLVP